MKIRYLTAATAMVFALASASAVSETWNGLKSENAVHKMLGQGVPFSRSDLPEGLRMKYDALGESQQENAREWMKRFAFPEKDGDTLHFDSQGAILYADPFTPDSAADQEADSDAALSPEASGVSIAFGAADDAFHLHSRPGSANQVYLDFNGHTITNTAWNAIDNIDPLYAKAFDLDGSPATFSDAERAAIAEIWSRVSEDYAAFDIDVTTEEPASFGPHTARVLVTSKKDANGRYMPYETAGGVAYVGVWGYSSYATSYSPALIYYDNLLSTSNYIAEACAHEFGHNLGLSHDGTSTASYYAGLGSGYISWAPIMGNSYYNNVTQWSKGEYPDANNTQDDIAIITSQLGLVDDDHGDTIADATPLLVQADGEILVSTPETDPDNLAWQNKGVISTRNDVDVFKLNAGAGSLELSVVPAWAAFERTSKRGANLDVQVALLDQNGQVLKTANPSDDTFATLSASVEAGTYYLEITGVGSANYSDYASAGQYFISGAITPATTTPDQPPAADFNYACAGLECSFTNSSSGRDGAILGYVWSFGDGAISTAQSPSHSYAKNGVYTVTLTVTDDQDQTNAKETSVDVMSVDQPNSVPTAAFEVSCTDLTCDFTDASTDDSSLVKWSWSFGDDASSTKQSPRHIYTAEGTYSVTLTVTDDAGATDSLMREVKVSAPPPITSISLTASARALSRWVLVHLSWNGAEGRKVYLYRDGEKVTTTTNDGAYTDFIRKADGATSAIYKVCETDSSACSSEVTVEF